MGPPRGKKGSGRAGGAVGKVISRKKRRKQERTAKKQRKVDYQFRISHSVSQGEVGKKETPKSDIKSGGRKGKSLKRQNPALPEGSPLNRLQRKEPPQPQEKQLLQPQGKELSFPQGSTSSTRRTRRSGRSGGQPLLQQANQRDKEDIVKLEKLLKIDKKSKSVPNSFRQDGLDCIHKAVW